MNERSTPAPRASRSPASAPEPDPTSTGDLAFSTCALTPGDELRAARRWEALQSHIDQWYHGFDHQAFRVALSVAVCHRFLGEEPVWLFIVGPAGTGKTVTINALSTLERTRVMGDLTPQTFLSGFNRGKGFSLLNELGKQFILLFKDFTTFLSKRVETRGEIATHLREIYDGRFHRDTGASKGLSWTGKGTVICATTPAIERAWTLMRDMGERFVTVRWPRGDGIMQAKKAASQISFEKAIREDLQRLTLELLDISTLQPAAIPSWDSHPEIVYLAEMVAVLRAHVQRESDGRRGISDIPEIEGPSRLAKAFTQIARGHATLMRRRECNAYDLGLSRRVALDTIPMVRRRIWEAMVLARYPEISVAEINDKSGLPEDTIIWSLDEMKALGVVRCATLPAQDPTDRSGDRWSMTDRFLDTMKNACPGYKDHPELITGGVGAATGAQGAGAAAGFGTVTAEGD